MKERNIYKELFKLVENKGDKLVVINPHNDDAVVVLRMEDYEHLRSNGRNYVASGDVIHLKNQKNFSFWDDDREKVSQLDKGENSGRIDELAKSKSSTHKPTDSPHFETVHETEEDDAGGGYYFEPLDSDEQEHD
jgi:hypothetical protein